MCVRTLFREISHLNASLAILAGLKKRSATNPDDPPLYIHVSGLGIISDNARGEYISNPRWYSDSGLNLDDCPPENTHLISDREIVAAATRDENPIRSIIVYPGWIYGMLLHFTSIL